MFNKIFDMDNPFFRTLDRLADLIILNLCFLLCSIPIFTIGAALSAMCKIELQLVRGEQGYIARPFFKAFKEEFKQSTIIWLPSMIIVFTIVIDIMMFRASSETGMFYRVISILSLVIGLILCTVLLYVFPLIAQFENTIVQTLKNAAILSVKHFLKTIAMMVIDFGLILITFLNGYTFVYGLLVWILAGFSLIGYINALFLKDILDKYIPKMYKEENDYIE